MLFDLIKAVILGIVEGLTEFLPVSSTGHLLLVEHFFGPEPEKKAFWDSFAVLIQFGAILALLSIYFTRLWKIAIGMFTNADDRRFVIGLLIAFLPAGVIGAFAHGFIKSVLFNVWIVCLSFIVGGVVLLWVDRLSLRPRFHEATKFPLPTYLMIGFFQCLAMIPGVSRSGATIVSAMLLGADRRGRVHHLVHRRLDRGQDVPRLCVEPRIRAVRLVAHHRRRARADRACAGEVSAGLYATRPRNCPALRNRHR